jgi:uncharacterized membrane protein YraQ (UPF0718 family)
LPTDPRGRRLSVLVKPGIYIGNVARFARSVSSDSRQDFALAFLSILFEGAPFILLGTLISGFIDVFLPAGMVDRFLPRRRVPAVLLAGLLGAVFPVCECAVVPVIRRLVRKGLPVSCALTYMLAAPIVNPVTALSTWKAFQGQHPEWMTAARLLLGFAMAAGVGWIALRLNATSILKPKVLAPSDDAQHDHSHDDACGNDHACNHDGTCGHAHESHAGSRLVAAFRSAMRDFIDVGVYFAIGVSITALFNTGIAPGAQWLDGLAGNPVIAPMALMVLAFILSLCSTSDAFIAATLDKFTWAAKLAFLTFGPMMDVKLVFLYQSVLRRRFILFLALGLFTAIGSVAIVWQYLSPAMRWSP